ncbi:MAG: superinfection exclusion B family protein [Rhizobiaceae bacterium]|nr:superinfection exclusion B family protein [Rhizobiaceae bacterium]MCV0406337.1 superinfection exclusion B family protein [Rhizobiaceae bacterium]
METLAAIVQAALDFNARRGFVFAAVGAAMLLLVHFDIIPNDDLSPGWLAFFWLLLVVGCATLVASGGATVYANLQAQTSARREAKERDESNDAAEVAAVENLDILDSYERRTLCRFLLEGRQTFQEGHDDYTDSLMKHHILTYSNSSRNHRAKRVRDSVWALRGHILENRNAFLAGTYKRPKT